MMAPDMPARIDRRTLFIFGGYAAAFAVVALANVFDLPPMVRFVVAVIALAAGALAVGESVERLSERLSPAATGVVQSVLGNLPELFLAFFALQAGLLQVVAAALVGSILGNALFVLGLATLIGGLRHGRLTFSASTNRLYATELLLGVAALTVPFLATQPGAPDFGHAQELSAVVAIVLLVLFAVSVPIALRLATEGPAAKPHVPDDDEAHADAPKPLAQTLALLAISGGAAAFVADWFVEALQPAMATIGMSESFAGLIVVALASNAVENLAGVTLCGQGQGRPVDEPDPQLGAPDRAVPGTGDRAPELLRRAGAAHADPEPAAARRAGGQRAARVRDRRGRRGQRVRGRDAPGPVRDHRRGRVVGTPDPHLVHNSASDDLLG